jgi:hypothetical protein
MTFYKILFFCRLKENFKSYLTRTAFVTYLFEMLTYPTQAVTSKSAKSTAESSRWQRNLDSNIQFC